LYDIQNNKKRFEKIFKALELKLDCSSKLVDDVIQEYSKAKLHWDKQLVIAHFLASIGSEHEVQITTVCNTDVNTSLHALKESVAQLDGILKDLTEPSRRTSPNGFPKS
jgi:polyhydroxyalkanoate synthesis regulator phasin